MGRVKSILNKQINKKYDGGVFGGSGSLVWLFWGFKSPRSIGMKFAVCSKEVVGLWPAALFFSRVFWLDWCFRRSSWSGAGRNTRNDMI